METRIIESIQQVVTRLFDLEQKAVVTRPDVQFGDFSSNIALQIAGTVDKPPREIAEAIAAELPKSAGEFVKSVDVAGPGFINIRVTDKALLDQMQTAPAQPFKGKSIVAEYSDPNPFKVLHAGHIYTTVVGDAIAKLLEVAGGEVHRVNYGGDVGRHVGITMWSIIQEFGGEHPEKLDQVDKSNRAEWMAAHYISGTSAFEEDEAVEKAITDLNKRVYQLFVDNDHDSPFAQIYWTCRQWSYEAFDAFYERLGTKLDKYYPESETVELGMKAVKDNMDKVFVESEGAIVFKGEPYSLHTRVFVNREGLPTYEAKEIGLIIKKYEDYHFDKSVVVTGNEQQQYMAVVLKAIEQFLPDLVSATTYVPHGMVRLGGGVKMSSRKGNIVKANDVLDITSEAIVASGRKPEDTTVLGAIKYAFLKVRIGGDIIYDPAESVALEGNSGPYLQYALVRARSILAKSKVPGAVPTELTDGETDLVRKLGGYAETVDQAVNDLMPHHICTYLYELAQEFNRFYEHNRVIDDPREAQRIHLVEGYADTLQNGLKLLNIPAPEKM